jgi:hypothetical protein
VIISEAEDFKFKLHKYETTIVPSLEEEVKRLKKKLDDQSFENSQIIEGFKSRIELLKEELETNIRRNSALYAENERLAGTLSRKGGDTEVFEGMRRELRDYQEKYEELRGRTENLIREIDEIQRDGGGNEEKFVRELEVMRNRMQELVRDSELMRNKVQELTRENEMLKRREGSGRNLI